MLPVVFSAPVKEDLGEKVTFGQRPEDGERVRELATEK